jgi:hypothetical protein
MNFKENNMTHRKFLRQTIGLGLILLFMLGCSLLATPTQLPPTLTPVPPTAIPLDTPTPTSAPESTPFSSGSIDIPQTYIVDLDQGVVVDNSHQDQGDFWFEAATPTDRYITPWNGTQIALVGTHAPGLSGCQSASYSSNKIAIAELPVGTYVCVQTNEGRYSQVRIDAPVGPSPGTLSISYTTW